VCALQIGVGGKIWRGGADFTTSMQCVARAGRKPQNHIPPSKYRRMRCAKRVGKLTVGLSSNSH